MQFGVEVRAMRARVDTANASCTQWQTYRYLDDEGEGDYRFGIAPCFTGSGTLKYEGRYAEGDELEGGKV